jgi:hypothetical protein
MAVLPAPAFACQCLGGGDTPSFLESVVGKNVSVLRVRVLERSQIEMEEALHERLLPERRRTHRPMALRKTTVLKVALIDSIGGAKTKTVVRIAVPHAGAMCGPPEGQQMLPGTQWYVSAMPWGKRSPSLKLDYVVWQPCVVAVLRVDGEAAVGDIQGASERVTHKELRALIRRARSDARVREQLMVE